MALEHLGLLKVRIDAGDTYSVKDAIHLTIDYLKEVAEQGDARAVQHLVLLAGVSLSIGEFARHLDFPELQELLRQLRPKTFNRIIHFHDLDPENIGVATATIQ